MAAAHTARTTRPARGGRGPLGTGWVAFEVALAAACVLADLLLPTLVLLALAGVSLALRREGPGSLGLRRTDRPGRMALEVLGLSALWSVAVLALVMPVAEHLTGEKQDLGTFAEVQGNVGLLVVLVAASWTLAALGEEVAYRGYVLTRLRELLPGGTLGPALAVLLSSLLFGLAHTEQGAVGVVLTTVDAVFFTALRDRYRTLWASVLAHGFTNTLGLVTFFLVGPLHGLW